MNRCLCLLLSLLLCPAGPAAGEEAPPAPTANLLTRDNLLPDPGGWRARLVDRGVTLTLVYTGENFGNPLGGFRQGAVYDGLLTSALDVDFEKLAGWKGLKLHALSYYPHGASGTDRFVRDLGRFSNIDFYDSLRLFELWLEQGWFNGKLTVRAGQLAVDSEFAATEAGALFLNSNFGALPTLSANMPVPIYAIAAPGVSFRVTPDPRLYFQGAVYDGNPDPDTLGDPSPGFRPGTTYNHSGTRINLNSKEGVFAIAQLGWLRNRQPGDKGLPGTYRVGVFYHSDTFSDGRLDTRGRSLADPRSTGLAQGRRGDFGAYLAVDQTIYLAPGALPIGANSAASAPVGNVEDTTAAASAPAPTGPAGSVFLRLGGCPDDRNDVPFCAEAGVDLRALVPGRPKDLLGIAFSYTSLSDNRRLLARDRNRFDGTRVPLPDYEAVLEVTYQVPLTPWLQVQPDLQYIRHPGGSPALGDALVLGVRTVVTF